MLFLLFLVAAFSGASAASLMAHTIELTHDIEKTLSATNLPVLVEIYAPRCSYCMAFAHSFEAVAHSVNVAKSPVLLARLNVEDPSEEVQKLREAWGVRGVPSVIFLPKGMFSGEGSVPLVPPSEDPMESAEDLWEGGADMSAERVLAFLATQIGEEVPLVEPQEHKEAHGTANKDL